MNNSPKAMRYPCSSKRKIHNVTKKAIVPAAIILHALLSNPDIKNTGKIITKNAVIRDRLSNVFDFLLLFVIIYLTSTAKKNSAGTIPNQMNQLILSYDTEIAE